MKKPFLLIILFMFGCSGMSGLEKTAGPPSSPPTPAGTAAELTAGTSTTSKAWSAAVLSGEFSGASAEVVDEAISTANSNGDTTHAHSQDDVHDYLIQSDTDLDGSLDDEDFTWTGTHDYTGATVSFGLVDSDVPDTITVSNYLLLAGGTLTGEVVVDNLGLEFTEGDDHSDCSAFSATGGGIWYDDSEGKFKKCQDNVLTDLDTDTGGGSAITFDIGDDGGDDSTDVNEFATSGDTNSIFTEPSADKILVDLSNNWPAADLAATLTITDNESTNENNAILFTSGGDLDGGNLGIESDGDLYYNPSTGVLYSAGGFASGPTTSPGYLALDSDAPGSDKEIGKIYWNDDGTGGDGTEDGDWFIQAMIAGTETDTIRYDNSDAQIEVTVDLNLVEDLEVATGKHITVGAIQWDNGSDEIDTAAIEDTGDFKTSGYLSGKVEPVVIGNCEGAHDGAGNAATLSDSGESLTVDAYIGMTLYNITDGSSCTVTDNDATTITCTLTGGTDNDWDASDAWQVGPGPNQSGAVFYISSATTIAHPATVGYVAGYFAAAAQVVKVDPYSGSMTINFDDDGTFTDPGAGDEIDSDGTQGDFIWVHNASATEAYSHGVNGSWADGGAS